MKRIIAGLAALLMLLSCFAMAEETAEQTEDNVHQSFTAGNLTPMSGHFFTDLWGNATSDIDVRDLLHGYNLIRWDDEKDIFTVDHSVVSGFVATENEAGDHTYVMVLYNDLYWSDGTKITAWDYAFSYLLYNSPLLSDLGAKPMRGEQIIGYRDYAENGAPLSGVRVIADDTISVTLSHEYLPFFYEMGLLMCSPYPISVIAPGVTVRDDGAGVYLANQDPQEKEPLFNAELLAKTIMDPETGYLSHPAVCSGPYTITSWDGVTAEFKLNPYYKGNSRGEKPIIERLTYTLASNDTMIDKLVSGEFDLINKVMRADRIAEGIELINEQKIAMSNYPRMGLSYISFACEKPAMADQAVRQAIAYCFDRNRTAQDYIGPFGVRVDGYYGIGQWMYGLAEGLISPPVQPPENEDDEQGKAAYEEELAAYEDLSLEQLNTYDLNTGTADRLLTEAGWKRNKNGLREKDDVVLDLHLIYPEGNNIHESLQKNLADHLKAVGIRLTMEAVPMNELLSRWYKQGERSDDMIYLASNFDLVFDPSMHFNADGAWSYTNLTDEALYQAALDMRRTHSGDVLSYMKHWVAFQERFNEILPMIPVYSNVYFDFYRADLQQYNISERVTWGQAILGAQLGAEEETPEEPTENPEGSD